MIKTILLGLGLFVVAAAAPDAHAQRVKIAGLKNYAKIQTGDLTQPLAGDPLQSHRFPGKQRLEE